MTKLDKIDLDNIKLLTKETKIKKISAIKIKKGDYEIEIRSDSKIFEKEFLQKSDIQTENKISQVQKETINEENIVKSPMVGVAYLSPDPSTPPYVKIGQHVKAGDTLLLIEAMKTFNEVKAPKSGVIKKILALNSKPVEFGENLVIFE